MEAGAFNKLVKSMFFECERTLAKKRQNYAPTGDRLINFKVSARRRGITPEQALWGFRDKHDTAIQQAIQNPREIHTEEEWQEWIKDNINYLVLLYALIKERNGGQEANADSPQNA